MYKGVLKINGKEINVSKVDAIDKGVDTYFKGTAEEAVETGLKGGTLILEQEEGTGLLTISNAVISKGGTAFEGFGQE